MILRVLSEGPQGSVGTGPAGTSRQRGGSNPSSYITATTAAAAAAANAVNSSSKISSAGTAAGGLGMLPASALTNSNGRSGGGGSSGGGGGSGGFSLDEQQKLDKLEQERTHYRRYIIKLYVHKFIFVVIYLFHILLPFRRLART